MKKTLPPPSGSTPNITGGGDRYEALAEILQEHAANQARDREAEARERERLSKRDSMVPPWFAVVLLLITAWVWIFPPGFMRMDPPAPPPVEQEEAALRFTMYVQVQRIRAFQQERGRLPVTLDEAGPPLPGMEYHRVTQDVYQLNGATERVRLTYSSDLPLDEFVGSGADVLDLSRVQ
jgi:hypothetical protein